MQLKFSNSIDGEEQLDFSDILIEPRTSSINSRKDVNIERDYSFKYYPKTINGTGVIAANMFHTGTFEMARILQAHKMFTCLHKHYTFEECKKFLEENQQSKYGNTYIFISMGIRAEDYKKACALLDTGLVDKVCIDVPNGYIPAFRAMVKNVRRRYSNVLIMAGNVVSSYITRDLLNEGADVVKVGIGSGSACETRKMTGVGRPQASAVANCVLAAKQSHGSICSDGGIVYPGDICKAFGLGADFVMIGGMLAGTNESAGKIITRRFQSNELDENNEPLIEERKFKQFYGMSSEEAQKQHYDGMPQYRTSEGRVLEVPYKGSAENIVKQIEGGLRSCLTYTDCKTLDELPQKADFYKVRRQLNTSLTHGKE